jgi:outer membrane receptor for ferrienterochelin and colicins
LDYLQDFDGGSKGFYPVPRAHLKYTSGPWSFRSQLSYSYRVATLGAEYMGYMANNRGFDFYHEPQGSFELPVEDAITSGQSIIFTKDVFFKELQLYFDVYRTLFFNKTVFDFDNSLDSATYYYGYANGAMPYSTSIQVGGQYELIHRTMFKLAYRYQDVKQVNTATLGEYEPVLEEAILYVPHLIYGGVSYSGRKGLGFELNATYNSSQRLPTAGYAERSPAFTMLNAQFSKEGRAYGQIYVGFQNLLNVRQLDPIVGGDLPFDGNFDASIVWGPIMGRQVYAGWRYDLRFQE